MSEILESARRVLTMEGEAVLRLRDLLDENFETAVSLILKGAGKVITTGIGKSGIVARKIMATMCSTGTTALFLHPVEALHGDLGMVSEGDVVLALSASGETEELISLLPALRQHGAKLVALTGKVNSTLAQSSDATLNCSVLREACPLGLAPTTSTTAALAMGDALAVVLIEKRSFNADDFRFSHPGGTLGARLSLRINEVMVKGDGVPLIGPGATAADATHIIDKFDLGTVLIVENRKLIGIFTDGDVRRAVLKGVDVGATAVGEIMTKDPISISPDSLALDALHLLEDHQITAVPVLNEDHEIEGILHLHDLLGRGSISFKALAKC